MSSRKLMRVPMDFAWEHHKVWKGYLNPYTRLQKPCAACFDRKDSFGAFKRGSGYTPEAKRFHDEWYGHVEFDPVAYGAKPIPRDHPTIRALAVRNVGMSPDSFMTADERKAERATLQKAGVDLIELWKTDAELKAELDKPAGEVENLEHPGLVRIGMERAAAVEREIDRLWEQCFRHQWNHHLIQADVDALVEEDRLYDFTRVPRNAEQAFAHAVYRAFHDGGYWLPCPNGYRPTAEEVNEWSLTGFAHDAINEWICLKARCAREGVPVECQTCEGSGTKWVDVPYDDLSFLTQGLIRPVDLLAIQPVGKIVPAAVIEKLCEEWEDYEPPTGDGFQIWETCSEGSPISPVFPSLDELCAYAESNVSTFGTKNFVSAERWKEMLVDDFVYHTEKRADGGTNVFM